MKKLITATLNLSLSTLLVFSSSKILACDIFVHCWIKGVGNEVHDNICADEGAIDFASIRTMRLPNTSPKYSIEWRLVDVAAELFQDYPSVDVKILDNSNRQVLLKARLNNSLEDWGYLEVPGDLKFQCNIND